MPGFNVDEAPNDASYTAELFATVRSNGRILDDFKCVLGGTDCLEAEFNMAKIVEDPTLGSHSIQIQRWPRDLDLRKGLLSGLWKDVSSLVSSRDASVVDKEGAGVTANEFLRLMEQCKAHAAARRAVVLADNEKLALQLQLTTTAAVSTVSTNPGLDPQASRVTLNSQCMITQNSKLHFLTQRTWREPLKAPPA
jgi:hypothetical protein